MDLLRLVCSMEILLPPVYIGLLITDQYNLHWLVQFNVQCKNNELKAIPGSHFKILNA